MNNTPQNPNHLGIARPETLNPPLEIAGLGARAHAFIIDWHIRLLLALTCFFALELALHSFIDQPLLINEKYTSHLGLTLLLPPIAIYFLYHPLLETVMTGRTPGKRMAGVRLVTLQGHPPGMGAILARNVFRLIDSLPAFYLLGMAVVASTRNHVRVGDLVSGLILVYEPAGKPEPLTESSGMALSSRLKPEDQALLLELLARWQELAVATRIQFARQFLSRINYPTATRDEKTLKQTLENLLPRKP